MLVLAGEAKKKKKNHLQEVYHLFCTKGSLQGSGPLRYHEIIFLAEDSPSALQ